MHLVLQTLNHYKYTDGRTHICKNPHLHYSQSSNYTPSRSFHSTIDGLNKQNYQEYLQYRASTGGLNNPQTTTTSPHHHNPLNAIQTNNQQSSNSPYYYYTTPTSNHHSKRLSSDNTDTYNDNRPKKCNSFGSYDTINKPRYDNSSSELPPRPTNQQHNNNIINVLTHGNTDRDLQNNGNGKTKELKMAKVLDISNDLINLSNSACEEFDQTPSSTPTKRPSTTNKANNHHITKMNTNNEDSTSNKVYIKLNMKQINDDSNTSEENSNNTNNNNMYTYYYEPYPTKKESNIPPSNTNYEFYLNNNNLDSNNINYNKYNSVPYKQQQQQNSNETNKIIYKMEIKPNVVNYSTSGGSNGVTATANGRGGGGGYNSSKEERMLNNLNRFNELDERNVVYDSTIGILNNRPLFSTYEESRAYNDGFRRAVAVNDNSNDNWILKTSNESTPKKSATGGSTSSEPAPVVVVKQPDVVNYVVTQFKEEINENDYFNMIPKIITKQPTLANNPTPITTATTNATNPDTTATEIYSDSINLDGQSNLTLNYFYFEEKDNNNNNSKQNPLINKNESNNNNVNDTANKINNNNKANINYANENDDKKNAYDKIHTRPTNNNNSVSSSSGTSNNTNTNPSRYVNENILFKTLTDSLNNNHHHHPQQTPAPQSPTLSTTNNNNNRNTISENQHTSFVDDEEATLNESESEMRTLNKEPFKSSTTTNNPRTPHSPVVSISPVPVPPPPPSNHITNISAFQHVHKQPNPHTHHTHHKVVVEEVRVKDMEKTIQEQMRRLKEQESKIEELTSSLKKMERVLETTTVVSNSPSKSQSVSNLPNRIENESHPPPTPKEKHQDDILLIARNESVKEGSDWRTSLIDELAKVISKFDVVSSISCLLTNKQTNPYSPFNSHSTFFLLYRQLPHKRIYKIKISQHRTAETIRTTTTASNNQLKIN